MVLVFDNDLNPLEGNPAMVSRESKAHFSCYRRFPEINGVIHAHPRYLSVFASAGRRVPVTFEYTEKFDPVEVVPPLSAHSQDLADAVVDKLLLRREALRTHGLGLILAWHGVITVGRDLVDAYDTLERLEWSACASLMGRLLGE
jgi:L-fuculose-phosphate aldolase